jgi:hypothetical protein
VFGVAGWLVWWEQDKSAQKDAAKTAKATEERAQLTQLLSMQQRSMKDMAEMLEEFETYRKDSSVGEGICEWMLCVIRVYMRRRGCV